MEQKPNSYLDKWINIKYFFVRKVLLVKYSYAFVVMPGGYGTLDEYFEALTLIQTHKIKDFPIIIFGKQYHQDLLEHIDQMKKDKTIDPLDTKLFLVTDDINEAVELIREKSIGPFGLRPKQPVKPFKFLFENS
jgi:uncharacterized protein (TIGR00730 family)